MPESGLSGSVRGVPSNGHPYRDPGSKADLTAPKSDFRYTPESAQANDGKRAAGIFALRPTGLKIHSFKKRAIRQPRCFED